MATKLCAKCGVDVSIDFFREKQPDGAYRCVECQIKEEERVRSVQEAFAKVGKIIAVIALFVSGITLSLYAISQASSANVSGRRK